jgi:molecular chaperone GrpE (heat shock protein)
LAEADADAPYALLRQVATAQQELRADFERLAAAVTPLLSRQYKETEARVRALELRIRARQERPLVLRVAQLLNECRRLDAAEDISAHAQEALLDALTSFGYQEFGSIGDHYDPDWHEPLEGSVGTTSVVSKVFSRGLACYGDVLMKAKVTVAPQELRDPGRTAED